MHVFVRLLERIQKNLLYLNKSLLKDICGPGWDWQRFKQLPDRIIYGQKFGRTIGKAAQNREKQEWPKEKPKLDNARKLTGIYFIDPDDKEHSEIIKNARRKLERPMAPAMPCKRQPSTAKANTKAKIGNEKECKTMYGCMVESRESTRQRTESLQSKTHEDRIAGRGFTSMTHKNSVHKFIPMPQVMKIPDAKAAVDKEWKKLETIPVWDLGKVKRKREFILETHRDKKKVHFATLMDICYLKNAELEPKLQKYTGRVVLRQDIVKDDSGAYAVFTEQDSSASQMTAAKIMDVIARLPGCVGQAADAISASKVRMSRCLDTSSTTQMAKIMG